MQRGTGGLMAAAVAALLLLAPQAAGLTRTPPGPDPAVQRWPSWPFPTTFGDSVFDPVAVFSGPVGVELGLRPQEIALREILQRPAPGPDYRERSGWRLVSESPGFAEYVWGRLPNVDTVEIQESNGVWIGGGSTFGGRPESRIRGGYSANWELAQQALRPNTGVIRVILRGGPCASGMSLNDRAKKPIFRQFGRKLLVGIGIKAPPPLPPGYRYNCKGVIEPPMSIRLPGRLGNRILFDAHTYPPERESR